LDTAAVFNSLDISAPDKTSSHLRAINDTFSISFLNERCWTSFDTGLKIAHLTLKVECQAPLMKDIWLIQQKAGQAKIWDTTFHEAL
jgi:hypothetical protein